jgi:hypothetical protein
MAMGWHSLLTHRGVTITGRRLTSCWTIRKLALPSPTMTAARSVVRS